MQDTPEPDPDGDAARPTSARRRVLGRVAVAAGTGAAALAGVALWRASARRGPDRLPDLALPLIDGRRLVSSDLAGRVTLVNFWATTCAVCVAEMPDLARLHREFHARGFDVLAIAMPYDRPDHVLHFARTRALPFPVALDPMGAATAAWGDVRVTPASWLVARDGRIASHWLGVPDWPRVRGDVERLLARNA